MASHRLLTALPVFNEAQHLTGVLDLVVKNADDVLVIDDGSSDKTAELLSERVAEKNDIRVVTHPENRGYGAALRTAFCYAQKQGYDTLVTIDCDGQHEPQRIRQLAAMCDAVDGSEPIDIVSGSRYLDAELDATGHAPVDRREINHTITEEINERLGLNLTDAFCGFKAYRVAALSQLRLSDPGYAMPLELWVQAAHSGMRIVEAAVPRIYLEEKRSFGGALDDAKQRLTHYREVIDRAVDAIADREAIVRSTGRATPDPCAELASLIASTSS